MKPFDLIHLLLETIKEEVTQAARLHFDAEGYASIVDPDYDFTPTGRSNTIRGVLNLMAEEGFDSWIYISGKLDAIPGAWDAIDEEFGPDMPKDSTYDFAPSVDRQITFV